MFLWFFLYIKWNIICEYTADIRRKHTFRKRWTKIRTRIREKSHPTKSAQQYEQNWWNRSVISQGVGDSIPPTGCVHFTEPPPFLQLYPFQYIWMKLIKEKLLPVISEECTTPVYTWQRRGISKADCESSKILYCELLKTRI